MKTFWKGHNFLKISLESSKIWKSKKLFTGQEFLRRFKSLKNSKNFRNVLKFLEIMRIIRKVKIIDKLETNKGNLKILKKFQKV